MKIAYLIPIAFFGLLIASFAIGLGRDAGRIDTQLLEKPLPEFSLTALDDEQRLITQDALKGDVHLVNIFGSWCAACTYEHPVLSAIADSGEVDIIGIDWRDNRDAAKRWLTRYGNPYADIVFDPDSELAFDLGVTGAPETFIVDKNGVVRYKHTGIITADDWRTKLRPIVMELKTAP